MGAPRRRRLRVESCLGRWRGMNSSNESRGGEVVVYEAPDGQVRFEVRLERETVWLSLNQMAELFGRDKSVISRHLRNVFESRGTGAGGSCCKKCNNCGGRQGLPSRVLQPRRHPFGRLPRQLEARHSVPHLGYAHPAGPPAARLHPERAAAAREGPRRDRAGREPAIAHAHRRRAGHRRRPLGAGGGAALHP